MKHFAYFILIIFFSCTHETRYVPDYDNGEENFINVKIAIDKEGWESKTPEFFKNELSKQWEAINKRFNTCDKKGQLQRHYTFKPDLDDIIVYEGSSYWGENGADTKAIAQMDTTIFKLVVIYDFFYNGAENGEYGGGCGNHEGIGTILVINANEKIKNQFNNHFDQYTYRAITHELGHFRGVTDLYIDIVEAKYNPVNGEAFTPVHCLMNDYCYTPDDESAWSDYAIKIINKSGNKKIPNIIDEMMYNDFARKLNITTTRKKIPIDAKIKLYPAHYSFTTWCNVISEKPEYTFDVKGNLLEENLRDLVFTEKAGGMGRYVIFLAEAISENGEKRYAWLTDYMMHDCGLDGKDTYLLTFEFD